MQNVENSHKRLLKLVFMYYIRVGNFNTYTAEFSWLTLPQFSEDILAHLTHKEKLDFFVKLVQT